MPIQLSKQIALIIVDVQYDFLPGGALAVKNGDAIIPFINLVMPRYRTIVATQDWHPAQHKSFASQHPPHKPGDLIDLNGDTQILWPDHCVQHSRGAELSDKLDKVQIAHIIQKGMNVEIDSYSGFFDNQKKFKTKLDSLLKSLGITSVHICGLATDYCVKFTALDAQELEYTTTVLKDGCRAVNLAPDDGTKALAELKVNGVHIE